MQRIMKGQRVNPAEEATVPAGRTRWQVWAVGLACVAANLVAAIAFLPHQSLWNDEATQLVGLTLDPIEVTRWLADRVEYDFGVPDDRMPPLSYWVGWAWSRAFGSGERAMRWLSAVCVAAAVAVVFAAAQRTWGLGAGAAAGLVMALSPNVIAQAVEIRAYPLLLLAAAGMFGCMLRILDEPLSYRPAWVVGLVACGLAAMYLHFFGLVVCGGTLLAATIVVHRQGGKVGPLIVGMAVLGVGTLGLAPFVQAAQGLSADARATSTKARLVGLVRLAYRTVVHPAMTVQKVAALAALLGAAVAGVAALWARRWRLPTVQGLVLALGLGFLAVAGAQMAQGSFDASNPSYNVWILPGLALLLGSGAASANRSARRSARLGLGLLIGAAFFGAVQLATHGPYFAHTAYGPVAELVRRYGVDRTAVIHDGDHPVAWHLYSPLRCEFGKGLRQYVYAGDGPDGVEVMDYPDRRHRMRLDRLPVDTLIVLRPERISADAVVDQLRHGTRPLGDDPTARALAASGRWTRIGEATYVSLVMADVDVFRAQARP